MTKLEIERDKAMQTPKEDLMNAALQHYEEASSAIHHYNSDIPKAIRYYYSSLTEQINSPIDKLLSEITPEEESRIEKEMTEQIEKAEDIPLLKETEITTFLELNHIRKDTPLFGSVCGVLIEKFVVEHFKLTSSESTEVEQPEVTDEDIKKYQDVYYANNPPPDKVTVTDEMIEEWAKNVVLITEHYPDKPFREGMIKGAKAMRDGKISNLQKKQL